MGIFGLIINQEDYYLYHYTRSKVLWISQLLIKNPSNNTYIIKKLAYKNGFDTKEFDEFIEKLEDVKFIENNPTGLKLFEGYENFNQQFY
jgi:predicted transcriptional regulator